MKNLKIGTKLLVTFLMIIILFCGTVASAIYGLDQNAEKYSEFYNVGYQITNRVMSMRRGLQMIEKNVAFLTIADNAEKSSVYEEEMQKELKKLSEDMEWLAGNFTSNDELLASFQTQVGEAGTLREEIMELVQGDRQQAQNMLLDVYRVKVDEVVGVLIEISEVAEADAQRDYENTVSLQSMLVRLQLAMAGAALVITLLLSTYLTRLITKPLHQLEKSAGQIVSGDFDINVTYKSKDELGSLAEAFRNMAVILETVISDASRVLSEMADGNFDVRTEAEEQYVGSFQSLLSSIRKLNRDLSITLGKINQSADQVAEDSGRVSNGSQALSQGATEQAAAIEQLAATIAGISHQVKDTAENALEARGQSGRAGDEMEECNKQMHDMMEAMEEITRTSNEIGKIIKTIEDIAFQTNILALNAAVEASRAGIAGKGFAVVADEVRNLASKSSEASKDTAELIESSIKAVARGTNIADSTADSLKKAVAEVRAASSKVEMIADAAENQADAVEQVTQGVDQIASVVQTNSDTAVESAAASQELSSQADILKSLVAKFILREEYASGSHNAGSGYNADPYAASQINLD